MPAISQQNPLSEQQLLDYKTAGWLVTKPIFTQRECQLINNYLCSENRPLPLDWRKGLAAADRVVFDLANSPQVVNNVCQILGENVILWGANIVERAPGEAHPWHTDIESADSAGLALSIWIALENTSPKSTLSVISGSHRLSTPLQQAAVKQDLTRDHRNAEACINLARSISEDCTLVQPIICDGQALIFDGRLWHGSLNQQEQGTRRALLLQFATSDVPIRIPDLSQLDWPFKFKTAPKPPVILISGARHEKVNRIVSPPAEWPYASKALDNDCHSIPQPLPRNQETGWRPSRFFAGSTPVLRKLSCHASILEPGHCPHKPHSHFDEEILVILDGDAELIIASSDDDIAPRAETVSAGDAAYYPAGQFHTIRCIGAKPVSYFMFRWNAPMEVKNNCLETSVFKNAKQRVFDQGNAWSVSHVCEGPTDQLANLQLHFSRVQKNGGYKAHRDDYDVAILLLEGSINTLGKTVNAPAILFHPARALHGLTGVSEVPAFYLVVEFHGRYIDSITRSEKLRWQYYSLKARLKAAIRWRIESLRERMQA